MFIRSVLITGVILFPSLAAGQSAFVDKGVHAFSIMADYSRRQHAIGHFQGVNAFGMRTNYITGNAYGGPSVTAAGMALGIAVDGVIDFGGSITKLTGVRSGDGISPSAYFNYYFIKQGINRMPLSAAINVSYASYEGNKAYSAGLLVSRNVRIRRSAFILPALGGAVTTSEFEAEETGGHFQLAAPFYFSVRPSFAIVISPSASFSRVEPVYSIGLGVVIKKSESSNDWW